MPVQCPRCKKLNPANATYCYNDGWALGYATQAAPRGRGTTPFTLTFPWANSHRSENFNQLVVDCGLRWIEARRYLSDGSWEAFFGSIGRLDLVALARQAARDADADVGLCRLLEGLPADAESLRPPKLSLPCTTENLGALEPGKDHLLNCVVENQGVLMLCGTATIDCDWLVFADRQGATKSKLFQTRDTHTLSLRAVGQKLRAGAKTLEGQIVIETNGGCQTVVVRATVPVRPFPRVQGNGTVLAGAKSPRELCVKAKARPKEAATLFEQGAVKTWYESNGWTYPVQGSQARGKGAVQQFFEALGLVPPPRLEIDTQRIDCRGAPGQHLVKAVVVHTAESKFVNVVAQSDQRWVKVLPAKSEGNSVTIPLRIDVPRRPGETLRATVTFLGNGQQKFAVPVTLTVVGITAEQAEKKEQRGRRLEWMLVGVGLLVFLAVGAPIALHLFHSINKPRDPENPPIPVDPIVNGENPQPGPGVPAVVWWDKFPDLAASAVLLKKQAPENSQVIDGLAVAPDGDRGKAYEQLAAKFPQLAHNPAARIPLAQFVELCCACEPNDSSIKPLLHGLATQFPRDGRAFPAKGGGDEAELASFWLRVACEVVTHKVGGPQDRRRGLTHELNPVVGYVLEPDATPDELKGQVEKAVAEQCYHATVPTAEQSAGHALAIRKALVPLFPQYLTEEFRPQDDLKLLEVGLPKFKELWPELEPLFRSCLESNDANVCQGAIDLYENAADAGLALRMEMVLREKWKVVDDLRLNRAAKAAAIRRRLAARTEAAKTSRAEREKLFQDFLGKTLPPNDKPGADPLQDSVRFAQASTLACLLVAKDAEAGRFDELIGKFSATQPDKPGDGKPKPVKKHKPVGDEKEIDLSSGNYSDSGKLNERSTTDPRRETYCARYLVPLQVGIRYDIEMQSDDFTSYLRIETQDGVKIYEDTRKGAKIAIRPSRTDYYRIVVSCTEKEDMGSFTLTVRKTVQPQGFGFFNPGQNNEEVAAPVQPKSKVNQNDLNALKDKDSSVRVAAFKNLAGSLPNDLAYADAKLVANYLLLTDWGESELGDVTGNLVPLARCRPVLQALDDVIANTDSLSQETTQAIVGGVLEKKLRFGRDEDWKSQCRKRLLLRTLELTKKRGPAANSAADKDAELLRDLYKEQGLAFGLDGQELEGQTRLTQVLESLVKQAAAQVALEGKDPADKEYPKEVDRQLQDARFAAGNDIELAVLLQRIWARVIGRALAGQLPAEAKAKMARLLNDLPKKDAECRNLLDQLRLGEEVTLQVWALALDPKPKESRGEP